MCFVLKYLPLSKPGNLSVKVTDGTDTAISSATITLDDYDTATTDSDGEATFEDVTGGSHTIKVEKSNYVTQTVDVTVDGDTEVEIEMVATRSVSFTVNDGTDGIQGAEIIFDGDESSKKTTGSSGGCTATLSDGEHEIVVSAEGYETATETITVDSTHTTVTISLVNTADGNVVTSKSWAPTTTVPEVQ
jgi:hypothetical protein